MGTQLVDVFSNLVSLFIYLGRICSSFGTQVTQAVNQALLICYAYEWSYVLSGHCALTRSRDSRWTETE
jgi:hypothetical protein